MSLFKYFGEQHGDQKLFWSHALNGVPYRGPFAPTLTQTELDTQVEVTCDFHSRFFDLSDKTQKKEYDEVLDRIINKLFMLHHIDRHVDHKTKKVTVYLEWSQRYAQLNPRNRDARSHGYELPFPSNLAGTINPSAGHY